MKRVLFVDDDPLILSGLQRLMRPYRHEFETQTASSAQAALDLFEEEPFGIIVSDIKMPGLNGDELLYIIQHKYPQTIRIILSGLTKIEDILSAMPVAHHFLSKPSSAEQIRGVIEKATRISSQQLDEPIRGLISRMESLPALPDTYIKLNRAMEDPNVSFVTLGNIIELDMGIASQLLKMVNSGLFQARSEIRSIPQAISHLGIKMLKQLVLSIEVFNNFGKNSVARQYLEGLQRHALLVARLANELAREAGYNHEDAFLAGLLHDIGKLVLVIEIPDHYQLLHDAMMQHDLTMYEVEKTLGQYTHAEIGAFLLSLWGMPSQIIEAVAFHHAPTLRHESEHFDMIFTVYIANLLAHDYYPRGSADADVMVDETFLESMGIRDRWDTWVALKNSIAEAETDEL